MKLSQFPSVAKFWKFNSLFERYSLEEAVVKACEMEQERAEWSQLPLLREIYSPGWKAWQDGPGAELVRELIQWEVEEDRQYRDEPTYPKVHANQYVWNGELTPNQIRAIELRVFTIVVSAIGSVAYSTVRSFTDGNIDVRQLTNWWQFDEESHEEMKEYSLMKRWGMAEDYLAREAAKLRVDLTDEKFEKIDKNNIRAVTRFQATRDGPAILTGALMMFERENVWSSQKSAVAYKKHYGYTNDQMAFVNVHTYIDIFHVKLGEYIVSKYAKTKEDQELVRLFYKNQKEKQREISKKYYEDLFKGKSVQLTKEDMHGNIG